MGRRLHCGWDGDGGLAQLRESLGGRLVVDRQQAHGCLIRRRPHHLQFDVSAGGQWHRQTYGDVTLRCAHGDDGAGIGRGAGRWLWRRRKHDAF